LLLIEYVGHLQFVSRRERIMDYQSIVQHLDEEIAKLEQAKGVLKLSGNVDATMKATGGRKRVGRKPKKRVMSEEARARIAEAQRQRWARAKRAKKTAPVKVAKKAAKKTAPAKTKEAISPRTAITKASAMSEASKTESAAV
jgi:NH3-dependent NAD+ synthetase